jgi:hypothetical protein
MAGKTFKPAPQSIMDRISQITDSYHSEDLCVPKFEVNIECFLVYGPRNKDGVQTGPAISSRGCEAAACIRLTSLEERVAGRADAVMWIDGDRYQRWSAETLIAIIDHELQHIELAKNAKDEPQIDDHGRPKLKLRHHDHDFGWFDAIAERHGDYAVEVMQAKQIASMKQMYLPGFNISVPRKKGA